MSNRKHISRWNLLERKIFIKKRFQADFAVKFLIIIVIESLLAIGLFIYASKGTIITGYSGSELVVARTGEYFLPTLLLTNLVVIGLTAVAGFVVLLILSHKIAGPLWRFEKSLEETSRGDLTNRFSLRNDDQMHELAESMNEFNKKMDSVVSELQKGLAELKGTLAEIKQASGEGDRARTETLAAKASERLGRLETLAAYFKTSYNRHRTDRTGGPDEA